MPKNKTEKALETGPLERLYGAVLSANLDFLHYSTTMTIVK